MNLSIKEKRVLSDAIRCRIHDVDALLNCVIDCHLLDSYKDEKSVLDGILSKIRLEPDPIVKNPIVLNDSKHIEIIKSSLRFLASYRIHALSDIIMRFDGDNYYNENVVPILELYKCLFDEELL